MVESTGTGYRINGKINGYKRGLQIDDKTDVREEDCTHLVKRDVVLSYPKWLLISGNGEGKNLQENYKSVSRAVKKLFADNSRNTSSTENIQILVWFSYRLRILVTLNILLATMNIFDVFYNANFEN